MKKPINSVLALVLALTGATAMAESDFAAQDANSNGVLEEHEFYSYAGDSGLFSDWDANSDGLLNENEFGEIGLEQEFGVWDSNNDAYLGASEIYDGTYEMFDENENGHWETGEWDDANEAGLFDV